MRTMVGMSQRSRSVGSPRRRRPALPLGLLCVSQDCPGRVSVFLVVSRSSSVARAAGPSVACGSHLLRPMRRGRSRSSRQRPGAAGRGRALAAAAGAAAARRSRGRPFRRCGSSTAFFFCVRDFCAALWPLRRRCVCRSAHNTKQCSFLEPGFARRQRDQLASDQTGVLIRLQTSPGATAYSRGARDVELLSELEYGFTVFPEPSSGPAESPR